MALATVGELRVFGAGGPVAVARNAAGRILFDWVMPRAVDGEPVRSPARLAAAATRFGGAVRSLPGSRRAPGRNGVAKHRGQRCESRAAGLANSNER
jgi:hypothetical protein